MQNRPARFALLLASAAVALLAACGNELEVIAPTGTAADPVDEPVDEPSVDGTDELIDDGADDDAVPDPVDDGDDVVVDPDGGDDDGPVVDDEVDPSDDDPPVVVEPETPIGPDDGEVDPGADEEAPPAPTGTGGPATASERTVRALHWNIAGGKENDCRTEGITRAVRRFARDHDVEFVGLNEVCPEQHRAIREALRTLWGLPPNAPFAAYVHDGDIGRRVGNSIFSRRRLVGVTRHHLGVDQYGDRNLLCGRVRDQPHLRFCSAHLTPGDGAARNQMGRVKNRVEGWWQDRRDTVVLSGDLNLTANDVGLDGFYAPAVNTPNNRNNRGRYREVDDNDPNHCRGYGERSLPNGGGGPCGQGGKIDFIFARQNRIVDGNYGGDALNTPTDCGGNRCSDHRPVLGRLRLRIRN